MIFSGGLSTVYVVMTAYAVISTYMPAGVCTTTNGEPVSLETALSISMPNYGLYGPRVAASSFATLLGFSSCSAGPFKTGPVIEPLAGEEDISSKPHLTKQAEVGIGVAVPFAVIMLLSLAYFLWRNFRKNKKPVTPKKRARKKDLPGPYNHTSSGKASSKPKRIKNTSWILNEVGTNWMERLT